MANIDTAFRADILSLSDNVLITSGDFDPSTGAGYEAPEGSLFVRHTSGMSRVYIKSGISDTDWRLIDSTDPILHIDSKGPNGFVNLTDSTYTFDIGTRTFTLLPTGSGYTYYYKGTPIYVTGNNSVTISATEGIHHIAFDSTGTLISSTSLSVSTILSEYVYVVAIYWDADNNTAISLGEERHGITLDWVTHKYLHLTQGAQYISGLVVDNYTTIGTGSSNSDAQLSISSGVIADEDLFHNIINNNTPSAFFEQVLDPIAYMPIAYKEGTNGYWRRTASVNAYPLKIGTTLPQWNELNTGTWSTVDVTDGNFVAMWIIATNSVLHPIAAVMGQRQDTTLNDARNNNIWTTLDISYVPTNEYRLLYRLLYECNSTYTNAVKARLVDIADYRTIRIAPLSASASAPVLVLNDLQDVQISTPGNGEYLQYNGIEWVNVAGTSTDEKVKITATDTTASFLNNALVAGTNISLTVNNPGANETLTINSTDQFTGTVTSVAATQPSAGLTISGSPITTTGTLTFTLANDLAALEGLSTTGLSTRTGTDTWVTRTLSAGSSKLTVTNGDGVAGNPTIDLGTVTLDNLSDVILTTPTSGQIVRFNGTNWVNDTDFVGTVTSVGVTGSTGLGVSGSPITTSGTITLTLDTGLQNLSTIATTGVLVATGTDTWATRTILGTASQIGVANGTGVPGNITISLLSDTIIPGTGAITIPVGTTAQRPVTPTTGMVRFNTTTSVYETYNGAWNIFGTVTSVAATQPASGLTISGSPITTTGTLTFALANDLAAVEGLTGTGISVRTGTDTWNTRAITGTAGRVALTNGDGVVGNPVIDLVTTGTAGTYASVTTDAYGRVTAGTTTQAWSTMTGTPTTLSGYGITDAQPLDADLTSIAGLAGTSGLLRKTAANTWTLDTTTYLTGNQTITLSGDGTASGTTSLPFTLNTVNSTVGTFGNATNVGQFTVNGKGLITAAANVPITFPVTSVFGRTGTVTATEGDYSLTQLSDVVLTTPSTNQVLQYNGTNWVNATFSPGTVTSVAATGSTGLTVGGSPITTSGTITLTLANNLQSLAPMSALGVPYVNGAGTMTNATAGGGNKVLITDSSGANILFSTALPLNISTTAGTATQTGFKFASGVTLTTPQAGAVEWDGSRLYVTQTTGPTRKTIAYAGTEGEYSLNQLSDVTLTSPVTNQILQYNGTNWVNATSSATVTIKEEGTNVTNTPHSSINFTGNLVTATDGGSGVATVNIVIPNDVVLPGTGAVTIPSGTTAEEPTATNAQIRFNTSTANYEVSVANQWYPLSVQNTSATASSSLIFDDMISGDSNTGTGAIMHGSSLNWINYLAGTGAASNNSNFGVDATQKAIGVLTVETGTTATGRSALTLGDTQILFGFCSFSCEWRVAVNALSTAAQEYNLYVGFFDNSNAVGEAVDGVYFKYDRNTSVNWIQTTSNNSVRTNTTSTVAVATATYQKLRIDINSTGTSANFFIDGTLAGTITTNIPTGAGRYTGLGWKIEKTAGTTNRISYMDYISVGYTYDTSR